MKKAIYLMYITSIYTSTTNPFQARPPPPLLKKTGRRGVSTKSFSRTQATTEGAAKPYGESGSIPWEMFDCLHCLRLPLPPYHVLCNFPGTPLFCQQIGKAPIHIALASESSLRNCQRMRLRCSPRFILLNFQLAPGEDFLGLLTVAPPLLPQLLLQLG